MSDLKKLFKRDRFYWGIVMVITAMLVIYMLTNVSGLYTHKFFHLEEYIERAHWMRWYYAGTMELEMNYLLGAYIDKIPYSLLDHMVLLNVIVALITQMVKLLIQETHNRTEVLRIFPVKSRNLLIYHYLSGLLTIGIPLLAQTALIRLDILYLENNTDLIFTNKEDLWRCAGFTVIVFMLHYSLFLVCKKVTNNVPGTILTFAVAGLSGWYFLSKYVWMWPMWQMWSAAWMWPMTWMWLVFIANTTVVLILLSYITDQKKDYARDGFYAFPIAHWVVMGIIFGEIYFLSCGEFPFLAAIAASALITVGVHFVARPNK